MARKTDNFDNFSKYLQSIKDRGYENLKSTVAEQAAKNDEDLIRVLIVEGNALLKAEDKTPPPKPPNDNQRLQDTLAANTTNPYVRARLKILNDLSDERRNRIEEMEKNGKTDNPTYEQFAKMVVKLGDQFSEKSN